jgi:hypothetical protein
MIGRGLTPSESRWPNAPEFSRVANQWTNHAVALLLGYVWQGYDRLAEEDLSHIDWDSACEDIERGITQILELYIHESMAGSEPFFVQHGPYEQETRLPPPAQPPQYDIAFVLRSNKRVMWPLEAKVLHSEHELAAYLASIHDQYLTCRYAPFSSEAAMIGYFLGTRTDTFFDNVEKRLGCELSKYQWFPERPHRVSKHRRQVPKGKSYPRRFSCHHLLMSLRKS